MASNRKPADDLAWVREQIRHLQAREAWLKENIIKGLLDGEGDEYDAEISKRKQKRFSRKKAEEEFGNIDHLFEEIEYSIVKLNQKDEENG